MKKALIVCLIALSVAVWLAFIIPSDAKGWGPRGCPPPSPRPIPKPIPQPTPQPTNPQPEPQPTTPEAPKPEEPEVPVPDKIEWKQISGAGLEKEELAKSEIWIEFNDIAELKETKPLMIYFYQPEIETDDEDVKNMIRRCGIMEEEILGSEEVRRASISYHCLKCNWKDDMGEELRKKYKITIVPKVLFFDVKGRKVWQLTSTKASPQGVAEKMEKISSTSKKLLEAMKK